MHYNLYETCAQSVTHELQTHGSREFEKGTFLQSSASQRALNAQLQVGESELIYEKLNYTEYIIKITNGCSITNMKVEFDQKDM